MLYSIMMHPGTKFLHRGCQILLLSIFPTVFSIANEFCLCIKDEGATTYWYVINNGTDCCSSSAGDIGSVYHFEKNESGTWVLISSESIGGAAAQSACCKPL